MKTLMLAVVVTLVGCKKDAGKPTAEPAKPTAAKETPATPKSAPKSTNSTPATMATPTTTTAPPLAKGERVVSDCGHGDNGEQCIHHASTAGVVTAGTKLYGKALTTSTATPLATVLTDPDSYTGKTLVVSGNVRAVCKKKGCWMELADVSGKGQGARITFENYGFFVPIDATGTRAKLEGKIELTRVAANQVTHYEAEGATFAKKFSDGSAREIRIVASGVELTKL